jgi:hypothetical protein
MNDLPIEMIILVHSNLRTKSMYDFTQLNSNIGFRVKDPFISIQYNRNYIKVKYLYKNIIHRIGGPAIEYSDGTKVWYKNGKIHREDGPAIEMEDGSKEWCQNGQLHRIDGPAIEWSHGTTRWYKNGQLHRTDGPAINSTKGIKWYIEDKLHREDGPAVIRPDYRSQEYIYEWYINGEFIKYKCENFDDTYCFLEKVKQYYYFS